MFAEELPPLSPLAFFALEGSVLPIEGGESPHFLNEKKEEAYRLPITSPVIGEEVFANVAMGWHRDGLAFRFRVAKAIERVSYPDLREADSIELFIDTRDRKESGFPTKFCHHFFVLPEPYLEHLAGEITRFRTDDSHPLCDPKDLVVHTKKGKKEYVVDLFLPAHCLVGYDPDQFHRFGLTYRINRPQGLSQHFAIPSSEVAIEQHPALWASMEMKK